MTCYLFVIIVVGSSNSLLSCGVIGIENGFSNRSFGNPWILRVLSLILQEGDVTPDIIQTLLSILCLVLVRCVDVGFILSTSFLVRFAIKLPWILLSEIYWFIIIFLSFMICLEVKISSGS